MSRRRQTDRDKQQPHPLHTDPTLAPYNQTDPTARQCATGCKIRGQHAPGCPCTPECPEHEGHCDGCAHRTTYGDSLLCGVCFHWRLKQPLVELPMRYEYLGDQMGSGEILKARVYDNVVVSGSHDDHSTPIDDRLFDMRVTMRLVVAAWADRVMRLRGTDVTTPPAWDLGSTSSWLLAQAAWCSRQPWIAVDSPEPAVRRKTLVGALRELTWRSDHLAPWQRKWTPVDSVVCPRCGSSSMGWLEGNDWLSCTTAGCQYVLPWNQERTFRKTLRKIEADRRQVG